MDPPRNNLCGAAERGTAADLLLLPGLAFGGASRGDRYRSTSAPATHWGTAEAFARRIHAGGSFGRVFWELVQRQ